MDACDGVIALHDAVAGDQNVVVNLADAHIVAIKEFVVIARHVIQKRLDSQFELAHFTGGDFGSGDVSAKRLDVDVDVELVMAVTDGGDGVLEFGGLSMGFTEREVFVDFKM